MGGQPKPCRCDRRLFHDIGGPRLAGSGITAHRLRGKVIKRLVIGRIHGDKLTFQMGGQLAYHQSVLRQLAAYLIAVGLAFCRQLHVKYRLVIAGNLQRFVAFFRCPTCQPVERVKRVLPADKLRQKNAWTFNCPHTTSS